MWEFDGNGDGTFQPDRQLFTYFQPFALADVNGDGAPNIARYDFMWPDGTTETKGPTRFTTYLDHAGWHVSAEQHLCRLQRPADSG